MDGFASFVTFWFVPLRICQEYGGIGAFVAGKEWVAGKCHTYLPAASPRVEAQQYVAMVDNVTMWRENTSVVIYTQITDVELEVRSASPIRLATRLVHAMDLTCCTCSATASLTLIERRSLVTMKRQQSSVLTKRL
jgi:hypothetical protein